MKQSFVIIFILCFFSSIKSIGCSCIPNKSSLIQSVHQYDLIMIGTVIKKKELRFGGGFYFMVNKAYKGCTVNDTIFVETSIHTSCALHVQPKQKWIIWGHGDKTKYTTSQCTKSRHMANSNLKYEKELENITTFTGEKKWYFDNYKIAAHGKLVNGIPTGNWQYYYKQGTLKSTGEYINGLVHGNWISYNEPEYKYIYNGPNKNPTNPIIYSKTKLDDLKNYIIDSTAPLYPSRGKITREQKFDKGTRVGIYKSHSYQSMTGEHRISKKEYFKTKKELIKKYQLLTKQGVSISHPLDSLNIPGNGRYMIEFYKPKDIPFQEFKNTILNQINSIFKVPKNHMYLDVLRSKKSTAEYSFLLSIRCDYSWIEHFESHKSLLLYPLNNSKFIGFIRDSYVLNYN